MSNCPPERLCILVYFNSFLCSFVTVSHFSPLSLFLDFFFLSTGFFNKILQFMFSQKRKGKPCRLKILYSACFHDLQKCSKLDSRSCCLQLAFAVWCLLTTVLLSKFKLYGSAKENCHRSGNPAG